MGYWQDTGLSVPGIAYVGFYFGGKTYVGTGAGYLYESTAGGAFVQVAAPLTVTPFSDPCQITWLFDFGGTLYAWSGHTTCLLRWSGTAWVFVARGNNNGAVARAVVRAGTVYAVALSWFYSWDGISAFLTPITDTGLGGISQWALTLASDGYMYGSGGGNLYRSNGGAYAQVAATPTQTINVVVEFASQIYGIASNGALYLWTGSAWSLVIAGLAGTTNIAAGIVFGGRIYMSANGNSITGGVLFSWDGVGSTWKLEANRVSNLRRVLSLFSDGSDLYALAFSDAFTPSRLLRFVSGPDNGIFQIGGLG